MEYKKAFFVIIVGVHLLAYLSFLFLNAFNLSKISSFEIAFFSILFVIFSSYLKYKKSITTQAKKYKNELKSFPLIFLKKCQKISKDIKFVVIKDDLELKLKDKIYFFASFFSLLKLFAYGVLVAGFLFLHRQNLLDVFAYLCGISSLLVCVFIFILYIRYESKKNY